MLDIWTEKYRPQKLDEIVGQEPVIKRLKSFVESKHLPHLLFAGKQGVGKTTAALCLANELFGRENRRSNFLELNASVSKDTPILVRIKGEVRRVTFEELGNLFFGKSKKEVEKKKIEGLEVLSIDDNYKINWKRASRILRHKTDKILRVHLEGGGMLKLTGNHSVISLDESGNLIQKSASELKEGDYLISFVGILEGSRNSISLEEYKPKIITKRMVDLDSIDLNENISWAFGAYLAEGALGFRGNTSGQLIYTFGVAEKNHIERIKSIADGLGISTYENLTSSGFNRDRYSAKQIRLLNTQLTRFVGKYFYSGKIKNSKNKRIPSFAYDMPLEARKSLLRGFFDGDGYGSWGEVARISSTSKSMLIDVGWLSRISGIESSVFEKEVRLIWKGSMKYKKSDLLPSKPFITFFEKISEKIDINWRYMLRHQLYEGKERISKETILRIFDNIEKSKLTEEEARIFSNLRKLALSDLHVLKIKKIEVVDYNDYVYDLSVPENEMFFAGNLPILLHNSDERGIDTIRIKIKDFARTRPIGEVPFKIIYLDEADALTRDAQQALRRTMEMYSEICKFILACNYSSKLIEPIQSRCVVFRFKPISKEDTIKFLDMICQKERLKYDKEAMEEIAKESMGDLRKAINILQACASLNKHITLKTVLEVTGKAKIEDVEKMLKFALQGDFAKAREKLLFILLDQGIDPDEVIRQIYNRIFEFENLSDKEKAEIMQLLGDYEFRLTEGSNPLVQLEAFLAQLCLRKK